MEKEKKPIKRFLLWAALLFTALTAVLVSCIYSGCLPADAKPAKAEQPRYIKYVEFNVSYSALDRALSCDIKAHNQGKSYNWIDILSYLAAKYGGDFKRYKAADMDDFVKKLNEGQSVESLTKNMKYYQYYHEAYSAVLDGLVGEYREETEKDGKKVWEDYYGLKAFSPIAKRFPYEHYDDFGAKRTYGYSRPHLGHDMMAQVGTPVVAVESGIVEAMGWNQYGGWRIGIRSGNGRRYYYYAHLRQNCPFAKSLKVGQKVTAGQVIGYVGHTGYSAKANTNNIKIPHLHFGLELIFNEKQKESNNEIWVDVYPFTQLLNRHRSDTVRDDKTKEYTRKFAFEEKNPQWNFKIPEEELSSAQNSKELHSITSR